MGGIGSGRQTKELENIKTIEVQVSTITTEALIELARDKVLNQVRQLGNSKKALKSTIALALPILLKSIKEHKQIEVSEVKPLLSAIRGEVLPEKSLIEPKSNVAQQQSLCDTITGKRPYKRSQYGYTKEELAQMAISEAVNDKLTVDTTQPANEAISE